MTPPLEKSITNKIVRWLCRQPECHARKVWGGMAPGEPDILCCWRGRMVQIEVKRPGNKPTPLQEAAMARWHGAGALVMVAHSLEEVQFSLGGPRRCPKIEKPPPWRALLGKPGLGIEATWMVALDWGFLKNRTAAWLRRSR